MTVRPSTTTMQTSEDRAAGSNSGARRNPFEEWRTYAVPTKGYCRASLAGGFSSEQSEHDLIHVSLVTLVSPTIE